MIKYNIITLHSTFYEQKSVHNTNVSDTKKKIFMCLGPNHDDTVLYMYMSQHDLQYFVHTKRSQFTCVQSDSPNMLIHSTVFLLIKNIFEMLCFWNYKYKIALL